MLINVISLGSVEMLSSATLLNVLSSGSDRPGSESDREEKVEQQGRNTAFGNVFRHLFRATPIVSRFRLTFRGCHISHGGELYGPSASLVLNHTETSQSDVCDL